MRCTIIALVLGIVMVASAGPTAMAQEADAGVLEAVKVLTPDDVRALIKSAQMGDARAQLMLALAYHHGYTVTQIQTEAFKWCRMAAEQGVAHAQHLLGQLYRDGQGVDQNVNEAAKWIGMAAEQGFAEAEYEYGLMSLDGVGVPQDHAEAFKWFDRAAEQESLGGQTYVVTIRGDRVRPGDQWFPGTGPGRRPTSLSWPRAPTMDTHAASWGYRHLVGESPSL